MYIFRKILVYSIPLVVFANLQLLFIFPKVWFIFLGLSLLFPAAAVFCFNNFKLDQSYLGFSLSPLIFILGVFLFLLFLENNLIQQILVALGTLLLLAFLQSVFLYLHQSVKYLPRTLENISNYLNILAGFFIFSSVFSLHLFAFARFRYLIIAVVLAALVLAWQAVWVNKISSSRSRIFIVFFSLAMGEIYWALHYWPTSFLVNGLIMALIFYAVLSLIRQHFLAALTRRLTFRYLFISGIILILSLATAQWT